MARTNDKKTPSDKPLAPMAGGAPEACLEIDADEYAEARRDPAVRRLHEKADRYAESLRSQNRLED